MVEENGQGVKALRRYFRQINCTMLTGWTVIVAVLLVSYIGEILKGHRDWLFLVPFALVLLIPWLVNIFLYRRKKDWPYLCYTIVVGYFAMYTYVMFVNRTNLVFVYILPLLAFLMLYHHPKLVLGTGIVALALNLLSVFLRYRAGQINVEDTKDVEIQIALILLCFGGCYLSTKLFNHIAKENRDYLLQLNATNAELENMSLQTIATIAKILDAKDTYTKGHSERVSAYAAQLARELGMGEDEVEDILKIGLLHDIGKVGISDLILNKPGRLTEEEFAAMRQHSVIGSEIIKHVKTIPGLYEGVRHHHERYDGRGYPDGLKGDEIPYIARLIAVCDAYDAMTSNRVYRKHLSLEQVVSELEKGLGTQFDPIVGRKMIELLKEDRIENLSPDMVEEAG